MNPTIFKAYDVRGIYPTELDEQAFHDIGRAFVTFLKAKRIGVGRDMRLSSPSLADAFIAGARQQGVDVVNYGMIATDMIYYAVGTDDLDGGAQITASHNPKQYNGCKMVGRGNVPLSGDSGISDIRDMIGAGRVPAPSPTAGGLTQRSIMDGYAKHVLGFIDPSIIKPFNAVLDAGCGMAGLVAPELFKALPCKTERLCFTVDGTFPTHEANPLIEENRRDIVARVRADRAEIGIAWDGDADRCFFVDEDGEFISGDFVTALLAEAFLLKEPGATVVYDLRASYAVKDVAAKYGGKAVMNRVGHAFFKGRMRELNAVFGGEVTGHYYFRDNFYCDNGFIPALLHSRTDVQEEPVAQADARAAPCEVLHLWRNQHEDAEHGSDDRHDERDRGALQGRADLQARWHFRRIPGLALQRASVEYGTIAEAEPGRRQRETDGAEAR